MGSLPISERLPILTWKVNLPGGQTRLREAILFVSKACEEARDFGLIKLNKILWRSDFEAFSRRGVPVTGRQYQRLEHGPAPVEMLPVLNELSGQGYLRFEKRKIVDFFESRPIILSEANLRFFSRDDIDYLNSSIRHYWDMTGRETSDQSHGLAWKTRQNGEPMPYESAYFSDAPLNTYDEDRLRKLALASGWTTL